MPELPEVETVKAGLQPHIEGQIIQQVLVRRGDLRWPVPPSLNTQLSGQRVCQISRRSKYLVFEFAHNAMLIHLGMSGFLRLASLDEPYQKHDHVAFKFKDIQMIYNDTRRFGSILYTQHPIDQHPRLKDLGPEPLSPDFNANDLHNATQQRRIPIKTAIMNAHIVVGVGNIYANEALFHAGIHPSTPCHTLSLKQTRTLTKAIKTIISAAISKGGTTLKDFKQVDTKPGYFQQHLKVYGGENQPCKTCNQLIKKIIIAKRSTFFCGQCQPETE